MLSPDRPILPNESTAPVITPRAALIAEMQQAAPSGRQTLDSNTAERLRVLTGSLLEVAYAQAESEYQRFTSVAGRGLELPVERLQDQLEGKSVLVTGGTGCIGTSLLNELRSFNPARVISVSRGVTVPQHEVQDVLYVHADIRDGEVLSGIVDQAKPDIIYHLAAQRDPSLAESAVGFTLSTNITSTRNVLAAAAKAKTPQVVYASTGKALRPFTPDTYAASKKVGEWLMADAASQGNVHTSGVRFTHVVDNSIIHQRLKNWIAADAPIRLHGSDVLFYMQSAREAGHLLLNAGLDDSDEKFNIHAIRDLEWPINLVDLALGALAKARKITPIYFCGFESGYEESPYPGLYDPILSGEVSPLISSFEAPQTEPSETCWQVDRFAVEVDNDSGVIELIDKAEEVCAAEGATDDVLHDAKDRLSWSMLDSRLGATPKATLERVAKRMERVSARQPMTDEHLRVTSAVHSALRQA